MRCKYILAVIVCTWLSSGVHAATVMSWTLGDFDNDGLTSDFEFDAVPSGNGLNVFAPNGEFCGVASCSPILFDTGPIGINVFTTGFNLGGAGVFAPNVTGNMSATIDNGNLVFTALDFGGIFPGAAGTQLFMPPVGGPGSVIVETLTDLGGGDWGVVVRWQGPVSGGPSVTFTPNFRLEGVMSTIVPIPAAVWLFGSGLVGLISVVRWRPVKK